MRKIISNNLLNDQFLKLLESNSDKEQYRFIVDKILPEAEGLETSHPSVQLKCSIDLTVTFLQAHLNLGPFLNLLVSFGKFCVHHGELEIAADLLNKVISKHKKFGQFDHQAACAYFALAESAVVQADWDQTNKFIKKSRALFSSKNDKQGLSEIENFLGTVHGEKGNTNLAKKHFESALLLLKNKHNNLHKSKVEMNLGIIYTMLENYQEAAKLLGSASGVFKTHQENKLIAEAKHNLGMLYLKQSSYDKAVDYFESCLNIAVEEGYHPIVGISYLGAAEAYFKTGDVEKSDSYSTLGLAACLVINDRLTAADIYKIKGMIEAGRRNYAAAEAYFLTSIRINTEFKNEMNYTETAEQIAILYKQMGKLDEAKRYFSEAEKYYSKNNCPEKRDQIIAQLNAVS